MNNYQNEGVIDRMVRVVVAEALLVGSYIWLSGGWQTAAYVVGAVALITAATGFCLVYKLFGISTIASDAKPVSIAAKSIFIVLLLAIAATGMYYGK